MNALGGTAGEGVGERAARWLAALAALATCAFHAAIPRAGGLLDDGGITLRYAERIANGAGFDYGAPDAINGATNPLYTFLVAGLLRLGVEAWHAVSAIAIVAFGAAVGLLVHAFARRRGLAAALFVAAALPTNRILQDLAVSGLETPLTVLTVAGVVHACHARSETLVGVWLGLAVANKLDGGAAAVAFAAAYVACERRFPWRAALVALAVCAPVFAVVVAEHGTLVPGALTTKLSEHATAKFDRSWVIDGLLHRGRTGALAWLAAASAPLVFLRATRSLPLAVAWGWLALHVASYSLVDLGAPYPWYLAAPLALCVPLAGSTVAALLRALTARFAPPRRDVVALALVLAFAIPTFGRKAYSALRGPTAPGAFHPYALTDLGRQSVGAWLAEHTSRTELFSTPFGLPAYAYGGPVYDPSGLNNRRDAAHERSAAYHLAEVPPGGRVPELPGLALVAFFRLGASSSGFALYARDGAELLASGATHLPGRPAGVTHALPVDRLKALPPLLRAHAAEFAPRLAGPHPPPWACVD